MIAIVTGDAPKARVWQVLDAAINRLGLDHVVIQEYAGAGLEAADWALVRGLKWTLAEDPIMMNPEAVFQFSNGRDYPGVKTHKISG